MPTSQYRPAPVERWSQRRQLGHYSRPVRRGGDHNATTFVIVTIVILLGLGVFYAVASWINGGTGRGATPTPAPTVTAPAASPVAPPAASPAALPSPQGVVLGTPGTVVIQGASPTPEPPPGARRTHRVAQGDTLARIAQQYGTSVDAIMRANNITDRARILRVGEELVIPAP